MATTAWQNAFNEMNRYRAAGAFGRSLPNLVWDASVGMPIGCVSQNQFFVTPYGKTVVNPSGDINGLKGMAVSSGVSFGGYTVSDELSAIQMVYNTLSTGPMVISSTRATRVYCESQSCSGYTSYNCNWDAYDTDIMPGGPCGYSVAGGYAGIPNAGWCNTNSYDYGSSIVSSVPTCTNGFCAASCGNGFTYKDGQGCTLPMGSACTNVGNNYYNQVCDQSGLGVNYSIDQFGYWSDACISGVCQVTCNSGYVANAGKTACL
ncbi:hypothetical protein BC830DRAFT_1219195, partial [Chytriomyces sp. MP71]